MGPEISTNIASMIRAMENVVMPALNPDDKLAQEQSYLIMVYLRLLADQHENILHFRLREIREYHALVADLLRFSAANGGKDGDLEAAAKRALDAASPLLALELPDYRQLADTAQGLRETADELTRAVAERIGSSKAIKSGLSGLLLKQANHEALRERSWVKVLGFDPQPHELQPLPKLLADDLS